MITSTKNNPLASIAELEIHEPVVTDSDGGIEIRATLIFAEDEFPSGGTIFTYGVRKATLQLEFHGLSVEPGSLLGSDTGVERHHTVTVQTDTEVKGTLRAALSGKSAPNVDATVGASGSTKTSNVTQSSWKEGSVILLPGKRWRIVSRNPEDADLAIQDVILNNKTLANALKKQGANRTMVSAKLVMRRSDLVVSSQTAPRIGFANSSKNKERVIGMVLAKAITPANRKPVTHENLIISEAEIEISDNEL